MSGRTPQPHRTTTPELERVPLWKSVLGGETTSTFSADGTWTAPLCLWSVCWLETSFRHPVMDFFAGQKREPTPSWSVTHRVMSPTSTKRKSVVQDTTSRFQSVWFNGFKRFIWSPLEEGMWNAPRKQKTLLWCLIPPLEIYSLSCWW